MIDMNASNLSTDRMLRIIEVMSTSGKPMRLNDIADESGVSSSTAMRILNTLIANEYARQNEDTLLYSLTMKFLKIGTNIRENLSVNQLLHPYLQEITRRLNLSCALAILDGTNLIYIDECISSKQMIRFYHHLGHVFTPHINASGKVFLSQFSKAELTDYCKHHKFESITPKTIASAAELAKDLALTLKRGYALNDEENIPGTRCFAVPIYNDKGHIVASVSVSGTLFQIPLEQIPSMVCVVNSILDEFYREYSPLLILDNIFDM